MHWRKHLGVTELYAKKGLIMGFGGFFTYLGTVCVTIFFLFWASHDGAHISFDLLHSVLRAQFLLSFMSGTWHHSWLVILLLRKENKHYQRQDLNIYVKSITRP